MIVKSGRRICGSGAALASAPIAQDKAYFEMKIQCAGMHFILTLWEKGRFFFLSHKAYW